MRSPASPRIDWNEIPAFAAHAHRLRSAEMRRMLKALGIAVIGLARHLKAPGGPYPKSGGRRLTGGPAPSSP